VQAAGLGKLTVNSALGQILNAEIDLVSLQPGELDNLSARVATPEAFRDARIEYSSSLRLLRFSVDKRANGTPFLKVTSIAPINEPFVDALIEVTWPAGRVQREYPILLDPPGYAQGKNTPPTVAAAPPAPDATASNTPPAAEPAATPSAPASSDSTGQPSASTELPKSNAPATATVETTAGSDTYGPVQKGETLHKIAEQVKPSTVSMEQMLVALYRENKNAFAGNNMNRLKTGQILKVPTADEIGQIEQKDANKEYRAHVADWKTYRDQLSGGVASLPVRPESSNAASGRVASAAITPPAPPTAPSQDVLKLSKSDTSKSGAAGAGSRASQDRINSLQEEVTAKDKALKEAQSRVTDLEKQIRDMQRLLDLKGGAAKGEPAKVAVAPVPPTTAPAKVEPPKPPEPAKLEPVKPPEPAKVEPPVTPAKVEQPVTPAKAGAQPEPAKGSEPPKTDVAKTEPPKPEAKPTPAPPKKAPPPPEKEWYEDIDPMYVGGGVGALALIGIGAFLFTRRRRNRMDAGGPSSQMTSSFPADLKAPSTGGPKPGGGLVDTGNSSFLTDFDKTGPGTIDTDEVDPVAEAEVYIAYGRDAQAEEILKEAMARDKNRHEIALKLLEIYHARKSATAFETVAKELHSQVGDSSPLWQKAAAMGHQIDPTNALYASAAGSSAEFVSSPAPAAKPDVDFDIDNKAAEQSATPSFDLDLDSQKSAHAADIPAEPAPALDFDLAPSAPAHAPAAASAPAADEKPAFDFDLSGLDFPGKSEAKPAAAAPAPPSGGMDLADLNLDSGSGGGGGGGEAVGTKLELAKAYLEIGDKDGARDILKEVAAEGSADQKAEAQKLIASL
jgi:pilus assembly protein FimV